MPEANIDSLLYDLTAVFGAKMSELINELEMLRTTLKFELDSIYKQLDYLQMG